MFVRNLEYQSAQDQLDRQVVPAALQVKNEECLFRGSATGACRLDTPNDFSDRLNSLAPRLGASRLLLLDSERRVVYDSLINGTPSYGVQIPIVRSSRVANISEARTMLGGQMYFAAGVSIPPKRDPLNASWIVLAEPQANIASAAAGDLATRLLEAGGAALEAGLPARGRRRGHRRGQLLATGQHQGLGRDRHARLGLQPDGGGGRACA